MRFAYRYCKLDLAYSPLACRQFCPVSSYLYSALVVSASTLRFFLFAAQEDEGDLTGNEWKGSISGDCTPVLTAQSPVYGLVNDQVLVKNYLEKGRPTVSTQHSGWQRALHAMLREIEVFWKRVSRIECNIDARIFDWEHTSTSDRSFRRFPRQ